MSTAVFGAPTAGVGGPGVQVLGAHYVATGFGPGIGGAASGAGFLAFTGVGPGTLPLTVAGLVSIIAGAVAAIWGRDKKRTQKSRSTRTRKSHALLPDLSHLADVPAV